MLSSSLNYLKYFCVLLLQGRSVEELVGDGRVGEVVADLADAFVTPATKAEPSDGLALKKSGKIKL